MVPIGGVTLVSTPQQRSGPGENAVLGLPGGEYVIAYSTQFFGIGGSGSGLNLRLFDSSGNPKTAELFVGGGGSSPSLTSTAQGFAVAYTFTSSSNAFPQNPGDIFVAFYDFNGTALGSRVQVNTTSAGVQSEAAVATLNSGAIVVAWRDASAGTADNPADIRLQILSANGEKIGAELLVNQTAAGSQSLPAIEVLTDGTFVVVWQDSAAAGGTGFVLRGQRFDASGARVGAEFGLATQSSGTQTDVDMAALPEGRFVAVWTSGGLAPDTADQNVKAQIFNADGSKFGGEIAVASNTNTEGQAEVAANASGQFVVTWTELSSAGINAIKARAFTPQGGALGGETLVAPASGTGFVFPAIASLSDGTFQLLWETNQSSIPRGPERRVERFTLDDGYDRSVIEGTILIDLLTGDGGNNLFRSRGGVNFFGNVVADVIDGGGGSDTVDMSDATAGVAVDLAPAVALVGGSSQYMNTTLISIENLIGSRFDDNLFGNDTANRIDGGAGNDTIITGRGGDAIIGGLGTDTVSYIDSNGTVQVNLTLGRGFNNYADSDTYVGIENVTGSYFNDILIGDVGANRLDGSFGIDVLIGALGADALFGGPDADTASYEDSIGTVFVNLLLGRGFNNSAEGDTYNSIENVLGSRFADVLIGDNGVNRLDGQLGNDTLIGGLGADLLFGGDGIDTASYEDNQGAVFANLLTGEGFGNAAQGDRFFGIENLTGGAFRDYFIGDNGANRLDGGAGDDILLGGLGADLLVGGAGFDTASYEDNQGAVFANLLTGVGASNAAQGDSFVGIEALVGTVFFDTFLGNDERNVLNGKRGADTLTGNGGNDDFVFDTAIDGQINVDRITDFTPGQDKIILDNAIFFTLSDGALRPNNLFFGTEATGGQNRIVYDQATGRLWFDDDGNGSDPAILFAVLENRPTLTPEDFFVI